MNKMTLREAQEYVRSLDGTEDDLPTETQLELFAALYDREYDPETDDHLWSMVCVGAE